MEPGNTGQEICDNLMPKNTQYRKAVGGLLYVATVTRPDISTVVNILSRRNETSREKYWNSVKRTIRYLNNTKKNFNKRK